MKTAKAACLLQILVLSIFPTHAIGGQDSPSSSAQGPSKAPATDLESKASRSRDKEREFQVLTDMVAGVPPEFGADLLMRLVESGAAPNVIVARKQLTNAFELSASAEQTIKKVMLSGPTDTESGFLALAFDMDLDRLSLQSRAVNDALALDPVWAKALFEQIQLPELQPLTCEEPLVYDPSTFYATLDSVGRLSFTPQQQHEGVRKAFLSSYIGNIQSHAQVAPIVRLLASTNLSSDELGDLAVVFTNSLEQLHGDERSFAVAMLAGKYGALGSIRMLIATLRANGLSVAPLVRATREYLVSNFRQRPCAETMTTPQKNSLPTSITYFNQEFRSELQDAQLNPITMDDFKDIGTSGNAAIVPFWQSTDSKRLLTGIQKLKFGDQNSPLTSNQRMSTSWNSQLNDFLVQLKSWTGTNEPEGDFFHEKAILFEQLVNLIPSSRQRTQAIADFIEFLEQGRLGQTSRIEWFFHAKRLLMGTRAKDDRPEILQAFLNSRDPTLSLYARFETWSSRYGLVPRGANSISERGVN